MVPQRSCHCVVDVLREWVSMLLSSRECPGGRQRYGRGIQGRVCRKRQISQRLAASLEQHTLHNYDDSISAIMKGLSLLLHYCGNPEQQKLSRQQLCESRCHQSAIRHALFYLLG